MAKISTFEDYSAEMMIIRDSWSFIEDKVRVLLPYSIRAHDYLGYSTCREDMKGVMEIWELFRDLLKTEEELIEFHIKETKSIISKVFAEMSKLHGIKNIVKDDTEIPNLKKEAILQVIDRINDEKDEEYQKNFGSGAFTILKHISGIQDIIDANSEVPNDAKRWILEKLSQLQQPENKPEEVPDLSKVRYKSLLSELIDAESQKFVWYKNKSQIHSFLASSQSLISTFKYHLRKNEKDEVVLFSPAAAAAAAGKKRERVGEAEFSKIIVTKWKYRCTGSRFDRAASL